MTFCTRMTHLIISPLSRFWILITLILALGSTGYSLPATHAGSQSGMGKSKPAAVPAVSSSVMKSRMAAAARRPDLKVSWNHQQGVPLVVRGTDLLQENLPKVQGKVQGAGGGQDFRTKATGVMGALADLYGIKQAGAEFNAGAVESSPSGYRHVRLNQVYQGLPVVGAQVIVHFDASGAARGVNGQYQPVSGVDTNPAIAAAAAIKAAMDDQQAMGNPAGSVSEVPALVVFARDTVPTLAWQLAVSFQSVKGGPGGWRYWVNAANGDILLRVDQVKHINQPFFGAPAAISGSILLEEGGEVRSVTGWRENTGNYFMWSFSNHWYVVDMITRDYLYRNTADWGVSNRVEMSAGRNMDTALDYYKTVHGRDSVDNLGLMVRGNIHLNGSTAQWYQDQIYLYDGLPCALDIVAHEMTHGVSEYSADLVYSSESGALDESFCDIFAALIEFYSQPDGRSYYTNFTPGNPNANPPVEYIPGSVPGTADWLIGEDSTTNIPNTGIIRDLRNPIPYGQPSRYGGTNWYVGEEDLGGVHQNNGVQNHFFYLLCEGGTGTNDGLAYSVPGIGAPVEGNMAPGYLAYLALTKYISSGADYASAREAWISAALEADEAGLTTNTVYPVIAAWAAVGVGYANAPLARPYPVYIPEGATTNIEMTLASQPSEDVTVTVSQISGSSKLQLLGPATLVFTPSNWDIPQMVTMTALFDSDSTNDTAMFMMATTNFDIGSRVFPVIQVDGGDLVGPDCLIKGSVNADRTIISIDFQFDEAVTNFTSDDILVTDNVSGGVSFRDFTTITTGLYYRARYDSASVLGALDITVPEGSLTDVSTNYNVNKTYHAVYAIPWVKVNFRDSFDGTSTPWTRSTNVYDIVREDGWRWGPPVFDPINWMGPATAYSGSNCWGIMNGPFDRFVDAWIQSPDIPVGENPVLRFQFWMLSGAGSVEVNGGSGWINVTPNRNGYFQTSWGDWMQGVIALSNELFGSRTIQIRFRSQVGSSTNALYIDDVQVESQRRPSVWAIWRSPDNGDAGTTVPVSFAVYNSTTSTLADVSGYVSSADDGVTIAGGSPISYGALAPGGWTIGAPVSVQLAAADYPFWKTSIIELQHQSFAGSLDPEIDAAQLAVNGVVVMPSTNVLTVRTAPGAAVTNWLGNKLIGNGGPTSCLFQVIWAGTNGVADAPAANGQTTGDDHVLYTADSGAIYGRIGEGPGVYTDVGAFFKVFAHSLRSNALVYVRAWDSSSFASSVAYGDSVPMAISRFPAQTNSYATWGVVLPTPGSFDRDLNGDSIPDGWCVLYGRDAREPVVPLGCRVVEAKAITDFNKPNRVAVSSNFVFVADTENNRVQVWNRALTSRMSIYGSVSPSEFSKPAGIAVSRDGSRVAVADTLNYRVRVFSVNPVSGVLTPLFNFGSQGTSEATFQAPLGVAFNPAGDIYVADSLAVGVGNNRLQVFDSSGGFLRTFGEYGTNAFQFTRLLGVGVGQDGTVYAADGQDNRVKSFAADDTFNWAYGTNGAAAGQFNWMWDAQPGMGSLLYLADLNNNRIQIMNTSPVRSVVGVVTNTGLPLPTFYLPRGVAPSPDSDAVYVADTYNNRVLRLRVLVDSDGDGIDDVWEIIHGLNPLDPADAALDPDGDGVSNIGEYRVGTDPHNPDTNGNGLYDGAELVAGSDPAALGGPMTLRITGMGLVPPVLTWLADSGSIYRVQYTTNLVEGVWMDTAMLTSAWRGAVTLTNAFSGTNDVEFIRVRRVTP